MVGSRGSCSIDRALDAIDNQAPVATSLRFLVLGVLLGALPLLMPLAHAKPPDPSWVDGIYDDADLDSVVVRITSSAAAVEPLLSDDALSVPLAILPLHQLEERSHASGAPPLIHARPPPAHGA
jgi:hypothetical protein